MKLTKEDLDTKIREIYCEELKKHGREGGTVVCSFIDLFGDGKWVNCSRCGTAVSIRPWLWEMKQKYKLSVVCLCCIDTLDVKGQIAIDFAKLETTLQEGT